MNAYDHDIAEIEAMGVGPFYFPQALLDAVLAQCGRLPSNVRAETGKRPVERREEAAHRPRQRDAGWKKNRGRIR